jgi:hypothetical protein
MSHTEDDRGGLDARGAQGVQLGDGNTQHNYYDVNVSEISSPYRGLRAFTDRDEKIYFGRDEAVSTVLELMSRQLGSSGLLVVSGVSGCGKSSLLAAGVQPRIRAGELARDSKPWPILMFTPAASPLNELAEQVATLAASDAATVRRDIANDPASFARIARQAALEPESSAASSDSKSLRRLVLVVDQFEQLFTQCTDDKKRRKFIAALHSAASGESGEEPAALVVVVVRADFEARCAEYPELTTAVQDRYLLTAMTELQLRLAITEPAKKVGSSVDNQLVAQLLHEMLGPISSPNGHQRSAVSGAAALPLLSHALDQTWRMSEGLPLSLPDYERTGGIGGAVAQTAQATYDSLSSSQRQVAQHMFTRLVATTADGKDTADRVARADLTNRKNAATAEETNTVLETFAAKRLLTLDADTVEISHEVLLAAWPLLRDDWLADIHADRVVRSHLSAAADEWVGHGRKASFLYRGKRRKIAAATAARIRTDPRHPPLGENEDEFLGASTRAHRRRIRARQLVIAALTALTVVAGTLAVVAAYRGNQVGARLAAANAETLALDSGSRAPTDIATAAQLALAAWRLNPKSPQTRTALANAYLALRSLDAEIVNPTGKPIQGVGVYGDTAAMLEPSYGLVVLTGISGPAPQRWQIPDISPDVVGDLSPDGRWFADVTKDGTVRLRDVRARSAPQIIATGQKPAGSVVFSPDSKRIAWLTDSGRQREAELRTCDLTTCVTKPPDPRPLPAPRTIYGVWLTPDPDQVLVRYGNPLSDDSRLVLRSMVGGAELATMAPHAIVARDGAAVVSCVPAPDMVPFATATVTMTRIGESAPPMRVNAAGGTCGGLGLSSDSGWLVEHIPDGNLGHDSLRLTDLGNGVRRQVTIPSGVDFGGGFDVVKTLGVSTTGGQPSVLFAHGTSLLRLRTERAPNDQGRPPSRQLADGGRDVSWSTAGAGRSPRATLSVEERSTGRPIATFSGLDPMTGTALVGNSLWLIHPAGDRWQVDRYDVAPFRKITTFPLPAIHPGARGFGAVSPVGETTMFLAVTGGTLAAVDPMSGRLLAPPLALPRPGEFPRNNGSVVLIPRPGHAGQVALAGSRDVQIWDALTGHEVASIPILANGAGSMAFDPTGRRIAVLTGDKTIELWDAESAKRARPPIPAPDGQALVGFDADGYLDMLTGLAQDRLSFIDLDRGEEVGSMESVVGVDGTSIAGDPVAPVSSTDEVLPYELPVTAQGWHDRLCAVANRPFTQAELAILPPGTDPDPPC